MSKISSPLQTLIPPRADLGGAQSSAGQCMAPAAIEPEPLQMPYGASAVAAFSQLPPGAWTMEQLQMLSMLASALSGMAMLRNGWAASGNPANLGNAMAMQQGDLLRQALLQNSHSGLQMLANPSSFGGAYPAANLPSGNYGANQPPGYPSYAGAAYPYASGLEGAPAVAYGEAVRRVIQQRADDLRGLAARAGTKLSSAGQRSTRSGATKLTRSVENGVRDGTKLTRTVENGVREAAPLVRPAHDAARVDRAYRSAVNKVLAPQGLELKKGQTLADLDGKLTGNQLKAARSAGDEAVAKLAPRNLEGTVRRMTDRAYRAGANQALKESGSAVRLKPGQTLSDLQAQLTGAQLKAARNGADARVEKLLARVAPPAGSKTVGAPPKAAAKGASLKAPKIGVEEASRRLENLQRGRVGGRAADMVSNLRASVQSPAQLLRSHPLPMGREALDQLAAQARNVGREALDRTKQVTQRAKEGAGMARSSLHQVEHRVGSTLGKVAGSSTTAKALKGVGKVAVPVALVMDAVDVGSAYSADEARGDGKMTETKKAVGRVGGGWAGAAGGAMAGAKIGAVAGAWLGPLGAGAGALLGTIAGAIGGGWLGAEAGESVMSTESRPTESMSDLGPAA